MAARRKAMQTVQIYDGEWYALSGFTHHQCCDCGAIHTIEYKFANGRVLERAVRDDKMTRVNRRMHGIEVVRKDPR